MKPEFWKERWQTKRIGFHQAAPNAMLERHFRAIVPERGATVLVPLCGKSLDMLWLRDAGYRVIGVELVEQAVEEFFAENDLRFERTPEGAFERYRTDGIEILRGDVFGLERGHLADVRGVFDRAALIALPQQMRRRYVEHLASILPAGWRMLLQTIEYDQSRMSGPPFSVGGKEVRSLHEAHASVERLERSDILESSPRFQDRDLTELWEEAWRIEHTA